VYLGPDDTVNSQPSRWSQAWAAWFAGHPDRTFWLLSFEGAPAGMVTCDLHPGDEAEIVTFGNHRRGFRTFKTEQGERG
jgi:hypothetical protein